MKIQSVSGVQNQNNKNNLAFKSVIRVDNGLRQSTPYPDNSVTETLADILGKTHTVKLIKSDYLVGLPREPKLLLINDENGEDAKPLIELEEKRSFDDKAIRKMSNRKLKKMLPQEAIDIVNAAHASYREKIREVRKVHGAGWKEYINGFRNPRPDLQGYSYRRNLELEMRRYLEGNFRKAYATLYKAASGKAKAFSMEELAQLITGAAAKAMI